MKMTSLKVNDSPIIVMFCGKGGVGKTTCASATAVHYAGLGYKTLLISTDPSPSLSDILEQDVKGKITSIAEIGDLEVVELDYSRVLDMWMEKFGDEVYEVISSFLPVGKEILDYIAGAPGISEEFALSYVYDLYRGNEYQVIIWDTAPAGGTLSLLHIQETFYTHMREAAKLYIKLKDTLENLTGRKKRDPLKIIQEWEILAKSVLDMVRSENTTAYLVTIPEGLGVSQTNRIQKDFEKFGIKIGGVIANNLIPDTIQGEGALFEKRKGVQAEYVDQLEKEYGDSLFKLHLQEYEVKGINALKGIEKQLYG